MTAIRRTPWWYRQNLGLSLKELAGALGDGTASVGFVEKGMTPSRKLAERYAEFFNVPLEKIFPRDEYPDFS
jgi:transcriptional regulator with XRE-family HTH domain